MESLPETPWALMVVRRYSAHSDAFVPRGTYIIVQLVSRLNTRDLLSMSPVAPRRGHAAGHSWREKKEKPGQYYPPEVAYALTAPVYT